MSTIEGIMEETRDDNLTVLITHYPSSIISTNHYRIRSIFRYLKWTDEWMDNGVFSFISGAVAHVCGHLHTLGDYVKNMYGRHRDGHLELELADWKYTRM